MKLTSSGNVMLVTFSFSRQRDGAIFKAYFQAIPRPGHHITTYNSLHHKSYAMLHIYINSHHLQDVGGTFPRGMAPFIRHTTLPSTLQMLTAFGQ